MRNPRITGVVVSTALAASLAGGVLGANAASADVHGTNTSGARPAAAVPGADAVLAQAGTLGQLGGVLTPATDLLQAALTQPADPAKVTAATDAVKKAIDAAKAAAPAAPAAVAVPAAPAGQAAQAAGNAAKSSRTAAAPHDLRADALTALQADADALAKAAGTKDAKAMVAAGTKVVTGLVNVVVATALGGGLPKADLPGLPTLPTLPGAPALPGTPAVAAPAQAAAPAHVAVPAHPAAPAHQAAPAHPAAPAQQAAPGQVAAPGAVHTLPGAVHAAPVR
jgi:hypothetical protein